MEDASVLLPIFEQAPHLSSMTIGENNLQLIFNDNRLHKYLNKMIKRLFVSDSDWWLSSDQSSGAKQLCEIFTNVEHLRCTISHQGHLLFLLDHLPKLSTLYVRWIAQDDDKKSISQFEDEAQKRNLIYDNMTYTRQIYGGDLKDTECERQIFI